MIDRFMGRTAQYTQWVRYLPHTMSQILFVRLFTHISQFMGTRLLDRHHGILRTSNGTGRNRKLQIIYGRKALEDVREDVRAIYKQNRYHPTSASTVDSL